MQVFDSMGTTVSLRFCGALPGPAVRAAVEGVFAEFDLRFSLYRRDSEISRVARGELRLPEASGTLRDAYAEALDWSRATADRFTPHRPDGVLDLSGIIKAHALAAAGRVLDDAGVADWLLNAGGDILRRGTHDGAAWRVGIIDPGSRATLLCAVELAGTRLAVATSGTAERGEHIWRAPARSAAAAYRQVTVRADGIVTADVLATALLAGGPDRSDDILDRFDVDILTVDDHGNLTATPRLRDAPGLAPA